VGEEEETMSQKVWSDWKDAVGGQLSLEVLWIPSAGLWFVHAKASGVVARREVKFISQIDEAINEVAQEGAKFLERFKGFKP